MGILKFIRTVERYFLVSVFLLMVFMFSANVLVRELGGVWASNFTWIEEAVRLMNIFLVFGAIGLALERGRHVGIDTLRNKLPTGLRHALLKFIDSVGLIFSLYFVWLSWNIMWSVLASGQRSPTLDIPIGWIYGAPMVGFLLLALRFSLSLFGAIDRFNVVDLQDEFAGDTSSGNAGKP